MKKISKELAGVAGGKVVVTISFEKTDIENLALLKKHMGFEQSKDVVKALIVAKCDEIKLEEEKWHTQQIEEARVMEYLEKGDYKCPM